MAVAFERILAHLNTVSRPLRQQIPPPANPHWIDKVLMQVVHIFNHAVLHAAGDAEVVEGRKMLHILAQANAAGVRADRNLELCSQQENGEVLIYACHATAIDLAYVDGLGLEELLEHDPVVAVLSCRDAHRRRLCAYACMAENVIRAGRLLHPPQVQLGQLPCTGNSLLDAPPLVGIDHQLVGPPNLFAHQPAAPQIVLCVSPHLQFEAGPALSQRLPAKRANLLVAEAVPPDGGRVRGISLAPQQAQPFSLAMLRVLEDLASLRRESASSI